MLIIATPSFKYVAFFYQWTPLHVAANKGRDHTVEFLLKKRADINSKDKTGVCETNFYGSL